MCRANGEGWDLRKAHSTPLIVNAAGKPTDVQRRRQGGVWLRPADREGTLECSIRRLVSRSRPIYDRGLVFFVTGLTKKELWAVKPDGQGDVTDTHVAWKLGTHVGKYASPILVMA